MIKSTFELEKKLLTEGYDFVVGIDEAGRGPLAGPVVACAAAIRNLEFLNSKSEINQSSAFPSPDKSGDSSKPSFYNNSKFFDLIRDSKTLSEKQRESLFDFIHEHFYVGVGICGHDTIDRMDILQATYLAMKKAMNSLMRVISNLPNYPNSPNKITNPNDQNNNSNIQDLRYIILLDGNKEMPNYSGEQKAIVSGDKYIRSISAASIIAKVTRDRIMMEMHEKYPKYGFNRHKGYGTKYHTDMIEKYGPCSIHRMSFNPVSKFAKKQY